MATCTKQSTTYKRDFELEPDVVVKVSLTLPFPVPEHKINEVLAQLADDLDKLRRGVVPHTARLFERDGQAQKEPAGVR